jgi:hypothetical protein
MSSITNPGWRRQWIYALLITIAAGSMAGRILGITRVYEPYLSRDPKAADDPRGVWPTERPAPMATLGANDRSRWATIRALVEQGTYVIGQRRPWLANDKNKYGDIGIVQEDGWGTIDKVLRPETQEFYSSKPPFLPTMLASEYWLLQEVFGWSITDPHGQVVRTILMTINWWPIVLAWCLLARMVDHLGVSDWGRVYVLAAGCFATFMTPFAVTLNNHTVACWSAIFALYFSMQIWTPDESGRSAWRSWPYFAVAGFCAGFTAANELPAAAFAVALLVILFIRRPLATAFLFLPAALVPVAGFLVTNYLAIGQWTPAYGEFGGPWYNYSGSYWDPEGNPTKRGIDWAGLTESKWTYAFHLLLGHHGLFSLSPIFLLGLAGMIVGVVSAGTGLLNRNRTSALVTAASVNQETLQRGSGRFLVLLRELPVRTQLAGLSLLLVVTVVGFYVVKTTNYGGWTSGPRWLMWLTPFFLLSMLPCVDWLANRRWGRVLCCLVLGFSVFSVAYPAWNPWRHPWLYDFMEAQDWIKY